MTDCWAGSKHKLSISDRWVWETSQSCMQVYWQMLKGAFNTDIIECNCALICIIHFCLGGWFTFLVHYIILGCSQGLMGVRSEFSSDAPTWSIKSHSVPKQGLFLYGTYLLFYFHYVQRGKDGEREIRREESSCLFLMHEDTNFTN